MAEKPKRPLSAYMLWLNESRASIKKENPDYKVTEVAKRGGELWRGLTDKTEWEGKAAEAKERYIKALQEFEKNGGGDTGSGGKKRGKKDSKKPVKKSKKKDSEEDDDDEEDD